MSLTPIYLDHNATTPLDGRVLEAMRPYLTDVFGNAASNHSFGDAARRAVEHARAQVAALISAVPEEIIWTSGATEANNLALKGAAEASADKGKHLVTQATEHKAVLDVANHLRRRGWELTILPVDRAGRIDPDQLEAAIRPDTTLVSIMWANNEIGTLQPVERIGEICRRHNVLFHTDATQAVGHVPVNVDAAEVDLLSLSGHKFYGPKGCGALFVRRRRRRVRLVAQIDGGGHERGLRSGTLNVPGIVGVGAAAEIAGRQLAQDAAHDSTLRDRLEKTLLARIPMISVNGDVAHRLPQTANLSFAYVEGESIQLALDDVAVSSGSACTSASLQPSHVLAALGVGDELAHSSIRFGVGRSTSEQQVDYVIEKLVAAIARLRELSPLYEMAMEGVDLSKVKWSE